MRSRTSKTEATVLVPRSSSVVRLRVGELDPTQARELRRVLRDLSGRPATTIVVDLTGLDDRHVLTLFTLLTEANRRLHDPRSRLVAVQPPDRLARYLATTHVEIAPDGLLPRDCACALRLDFGAVSATACSGVGVVTCEFAGSCLSTSG